jgi:hypothetical protein
VAGGNDYSGFNGRITTTGNIDPNYLQIRYADKKINYGSTGNETILSENFYTAESYGHTGDDTFQFSTTPANQNHTVKDFSGNDKLSIPVVESQNYNIQNDNNTPMLYKRICNIFNSCTNYKMVRVEGSKADYQKMMDRLNDYKANSSNDYFIN